MGDKYLIQDLKAYASKRFRDTVSDQEGSRLAESVLAAYTATPDSDRALRDAVLYGITRCKERIEKLTKDPELSQIASDIPCFGYELWKMTGEMDGA